MNCTRKIEVSNQSNALFIMALAIGGALVVIGAACSHSLAAGAPRAAQFEYQQPKMGTVFRILIWAPDQKTADAAAEAAWERIDQLNHELSDYEADSELNQLCRRTDKGPMTEPVAVGDDLWAILVDSIEAAKLSEGAFDITVGPLTRLQRQSRKTDQLPDPQKLKQAMESVGWKHVRLIPEHHRVQLLRAKMQLDVGGIGKGFTSDEVIKLLKERGIKSALCGAAGDIAVGDAPPGREDWRIAIQSLKSPEKISDYIHIHDYGISTSGDTYRSAVVGNKHYSHIIDPRTGLGLTSHIGVTTAAPRGTVTDWTGTAISILGPEKGLAMIDRIKGAAARIVTVDEQGHEKVYESKRLKQFLVADSAASGPVVHPVE
jgi:FAD:protein FMN transferase